MGSPHRSRKCTRRVPKVTVDQRQIVKIVRQGNIVASTHCPGIKVPRMGCSWANLFFLLFLPLELGCQPHTATRCRPTKYLHWTVCRSGYLITPVRGEVRHAKAHATRVRVMVSALFGSNSPGIAGCGVDRLASLCRRVGQASVGSFGCSVKASSDWYPSKAKSSGIGLFA